MLEQEILKMVQEGRIANQKEQQLRHPNILGEKISFQCGERSISMLFYPAQRQDAPVMINVHGGGFVFGGPEYEDVWCEYINKTLDMTVINVEYRLAPEHPFPCGLNDVYDTIIWVYENAERLRINASQMILCGNSAGANLVTAVCYMLKENTKINPLAQILIYPVLDGETPPEKKFFMEGVIPLERAQMYNACYYTEMNKRDPLSSPIFRTIEDLRGMPPAWILTCEVDSLRDEGEEYAHKLMSAGVEVVGKRVYGYRHGFFMKDQMTETRKIYKEVVRYIRWKLEENS